MKKRILTIVLALGMVLAQLMPAYAAPSWPKIDAEIEAEGAILIDADSGAVLYAKNPHEKYYPASITKILTALIVIENVENLDENMVFSHRAVYDVESGSSSAGYDEGDIISVRTALYAMLLASANEVANALAEHVGGSREGFCEMMNQKAVELGCTDSHFGNPSGLNGEDHYTSPADFAAICRAAYENDIFVQIDGTTYYELPPSKRRPDVTTIYAHHSMLKKNNKLYYDGIIGGKTGYTSKAGNTLVTCAKRDNLKLITVVLNGHKTHYSDTQKLLDFGFANFKSVSLDDYATEYNKVFRDIDITGLGTEGDDVISLYPSSKITLPKEADIADAQSSLSYDPGKPAPEDAVARIGYTYGQHEIGCTYVLRKMQRQLTEISLTPEEPKTQAEEITDGILELPLWVKIAAAAGILALIAGAVLLILHAKKKKRSRSVLLSGDRGRSRRRL